MIEAFIGLGSNIGNGVDNLLRAWNRLGEDQEIRRLRLSNPYHTKPLGLETGNWFTNAVGLIATGRPPEELLRIMLAVEVELGRDRVREQGKVTDRIIDLDLLYYGDMIRDSPEISLPHPEMQNRLFVLAPLVELAPDHCHPTNGLSSSLMLDRLLSGLNKGPASQIAEKMSWPAGERRAE